MIEFVDSDLYFVQDKCYKFFVTGRIRNVEKSTGSGGPKITGSGSSSLQLSIILFIKKMLQKNEREKLKYVTFLQKEIQINQSRFQYVLSH